MQPIQISDPVKHNGVAFGIDLGTTHSLIAIADKLKNVKIFKDKDNNELLPSIISYTESGDIKVGSDDMHIVRSIKRLMGKNVSDLNNEEIRYEIDGESQKIIRVKLGNEKYLTPIEISAEILKALCERVKNSSDLEVKRAVITVPAYFDDSARNATKYAAKLAGIEVLRLLNEPTAAALAYSMSKRIDKGVYAVYDIGGGTFDISILKLHDGAFQVLGVGGDTNLGGDDFDHLLTSLILEKCGRKVYNKNSQLGLLTQSRDIKEYLTNNDFGNFTFNIDNKPFVCDITRKEFENVIKHLVDETIKIVVRTVESVNFKVNDIKGVILVGGTTRVPLVKDSLFKLFGNKILQDIDPEKAVVAGAALHAHYLTSGDGKILLDVLPLSLGIETMGGIVEKIIHRNTPLPASEVKEFTTYADKQTAIRIHICQGEREMIEQNKSLAQFELKNIPPLPAGSVTIEVEFTANVDGILTVTAREKTTNVEQVVTVDSTFGLEKDYIKTAIDDSIENFDKDMQLKSAAKNEIMNKKFMQLVKNFTFQPKGKNSS
ncbi:Hsp70 family protein [Wolbachia endosymbiont of Pentidionis agamae]|uniref:Hsp70 family protein n=1 Tax=Wolbachia endosymbiont of Pentidionis agamae TaxID=3110435 RepID=UPI002FD11DDC